MNATWSWLCFSLSQEEGEEHKPLKPKIKKGGYTTYLDMDKDFDQSLNKDKDKLW